MDSGTRACAILAVSEGPQSHLRYSLWYRSSHGTDFDMSEIASPENHTKDGHGTLCRDCILMGTTRVLI